MLLNRREALALIAGSTVDLDPSTSRALRAAGSPGVPPPSGRVIALETPWLSLSLSAETGSYELEDKQTKVTWRSNPFRQRFGTVSLKVNGKQQEADLGPCDVTRVGDGLELMFAPAANKTDAESGTEQFRLAVRVNPVDDGKGLEISYSTPDSTAVEGVRLLDDALWVTDAEGGYAAVPARMGLLIPASTGLEFNHHFDTYAYEGCHMAMIGLVKDGATALITWEDPYVDTQLSSTLLRAGALAGRQVVSTSIILRKSAHSVQVRFTGRGDHLTIASAYRQIAAQRGWLVPWSEKLKANPERAKLFGAVNYKLWSALDRTMNEDSTKEESVKLNWTFAEAAQVAEHLRNDLKLEKVLFIIGGWTHRGYDNQHPDVMPPNPECGGGEALAACAARVKELGYLFCLHDNYQDIYRDSPSWSDGLVMEQPDGSLARGGRWAGGRAYLVCSQEEVNLARRPQNLPAVKKLTDANAYFIDTTYASGLQECYNPRHPLTRVDDLKWKQALSDYARSVFGIFGSEDGREWAVPHADFFEGLTGVEGDWFHNHKLMRNVGGVSIPLFEIVYRDSIALYGKYGFDIAQSAECVLYHISIGRTLNYHAIPPHLYWRGSPPKPEPPAEAPSNASDGRAPNTTAADPALFTRADHGWAEGLHPLDRFVKNTYEILSPLHELTAQMRLTGHRFLTPDRKVQRTVFGEGLEQVEVLVNASAVNFRYASKSGGVVLLPPNGFLIESPPFVAFHAVTWNGVTYDPGSAPLFTLLSLDGKSLDHSGRVGVYHGFGSTRLKLFGVTHEIEKEAVLSRVQP